MKVKCIDATNEHGTGLGLLTHGKVYIVYGQHGGYYEIMCDNGRMLTKSKSRFVEHKE
jgi:hypothetical protein